MYSKKRKYGRSNLSLKKNKKWVYQTYTYLNSKSGKKVIQTKYIGEVSKRELDRLRKSYDDYFDDILIDEIVNDFERADKLGLTLSRKQLGGNHITQRDQSLFYDQMSDAIASGRTREIVNAINGDILDSWLEKYPVIDSCTYE